MTRNPAPEQTRPQRATQSNPFAYTVLFTCETLRTAEHVSRREQGAGAVFSRGCGTAFPDATATLEDILAEGDRVAYRLTVRGTHRGDFQGTPPTSTRVTVSFTAIVRIEDGKLVEEWGGLDLFDLRRQIAASSQTSDVTRAD